MKTLTVLFLILSMISISAQEFDPGEFAPIGAIWHYDQATINPSLTSFHTIESVGDTTINSITCRKLLVTSRHAGLQTSWLYMYSSHDSVFLYADNAFHLIYDFSAAPGDTVHVGHFTTHNGLPLQMIIDSVGTIPINGLERKVQYVTCGDNIFIEFGGTIIDRIGNTNYLLPIFDMWVDGPLRCYSDSSVGLFINAHRPVYGWNFQDCEQVITIGVEEPDGAATISVYPNPTASLLFISGLDAETPYILYDFQGRQVSRGTVLLSSSIDLSGLPNGIYSLVLLNKEAGAVTQKVISKFSH